jgi:hypothetical protein
MTKYNAQKKKEISKLNYALMKMINVQKQRLISVFKIVFLNNN